MRSSRRGLRLAPAAMLLLATGGAVAAEQGDEVDRGRYLVTIMVCGDCHTRGSLLGRADPDLFLGGAEAGFHLPDLGYFYPPNLTPDPATGLGEWSEDDIVRALRTGERPDGRVLAPIMPYPYYAALTDEDAYAIAAFLKRLPPVEFAAPPPTAEGETPPGPYLSLQVP
jgi:mono/diheme cytochrome c family protein